jgi:hypothetical protein
VAQGRLAEAAQYFKQVHEGRPGDPFSASWLSILGTFVGDDDMAEAWIAAARARGADNRWELLAREISAQSRGDWAGLDGVGSARGGYLGAYLRGLAATGQERWPDARHALSDALRLGGYREGQTIAAHHVPALILMAWLDKRDGQPAAAARLAAVQGYLERVQAEGGIAQNAGSTRAQLARVAAIAGDRESSLDYLRAAAAKEGHRHFWFLEHDAIYGPWRDDPDFKALANEMRSLARAEHARIVEAGLQRPAP